MNGEMYQKIVKSVRNLLSQRGSVTVAIDGRCGAGKSTLSEILSEDLAANVFHADDFFLTPEMRNEQRMSEPGGNLDRERLTDEVLIPLSQKNDVSYRRYDCSERCILPAVTIPFRPVNIVEGSYSCHPEMAKYYDFKIFVDVDPARQAERIIAREGEEKSKMFFEKWIPLEEKYFGFFDTRSSCDIIVNFDKK